jgi:hypothetical protein
MNIHFLEPHHRILKQENKSKLFLPESDLYIFLEKYRQNIINYSNYSVANKRMDYHIQILNKDEEHIVDLFLKRVKELEGKSIDVFKITNYGYIGNAFVLFTPLLYGYCITHITIAYFNGNSKNLPNILDILKMNPFNFELTNKPINYDHDTINNITIKSNNT